MQDNLTPERRSEIESWLDTNWGCECWEGPSSDGPDINAFIRELLAEIDRLSSLHTVVDEPGKMLFYDDR